MAIRKPYGWWVVAATLFALSALLRLPSVLPVYTRCFYAPLQTSRGWCFGWFSFSIGDILYAAAGLLLVAALVWAIHWCWLRPTGRELFRKLSQVVCGISVIYCLFQLGWGVNYARQPLREQWALEAHIDSNTLFQYDAWLVDQLNEGSANYTDMPSNEMNTLLAALYGTQTNCPLVLRGGNVKISVYSYWLVRLGIEGYYNPFTGEAQLEGGQPACMLPFVTAHEMAHQAGVAAEDDANLVAYLVCSRSSNATLRYSACFNVWLYVHSRARRLNRTRALQQEARLLPLPKSHLSAIRQRQRLYQETMGGLSNAFYDRFLKTQSQAEGVATYAHIITDSWALRWKQWPVGKKLDLY
ncbi:MAG: DUF3810 domain-containing protein [Chitinophagia bacterium]|nr:DUF3810 domain-containing protein [Chitinophagia bacterium]